MRTTPAENDRIGELIAAFVSARPDAVAVLPLAGCRRSIAPGGRSGIRPPTTRCSALSAPPAGGQVIEVDTHINDPAFAAAVVELVGEMRAAR